MIFFEMKRAFQTKVAVMAFAVFACTSFTENSVSAATILGGIEIGGQVTVGSTNSLTQVEFIENGIVVAATGDFAAFTTPIATVVGLTDIDFSSPSQIWTSGGFSFVASSFTNIVASLQGGKNFTAIGVLTGNGFDATAGEFYFSSQTAGVLASFSSSTVPTAVPLPASLSLTMIGLGMLGIRRLKRR